MTNTSKPALPRGCETDPRWMQDGMSLLEYYAGVAMRGILANSAIYPKEGIEEFQLTVSQWAVRQANALIAELAKEKSRYLSGKPK